MRIRKNNFSNRLQKAKKDGWKIVQKQGLPLLWLVPPFESSFSSNNVEKWRIKKYRDVQVMVPEKFDRRYSRYHFYLVN